MRLRCIFSVVIVVGLIAPAFSAEETSAAQKTALDTLDGVIARFDALLAKDDDASHKAATKVVLDEFKERRAALRRTFDQARYDELRIDLNLEYQRLASWMAPPTSPSPAAKNKASGAKGK